MSGKQAGKNVHLLVMSGNYFQFSVGIEARERDVVW